MISVTQEDFFALVVLLLGLCVLAVVQLRRTTARDEQIDSLRSALQDTNRRYLQVYADNIKMQRALKEAGLRVMVSHRQTAEDFDRHVEQALRLLSDEEADDDR